MSDTKYTFQYCQKIVVLNQQLDEVLLAKRKGETDYDGTFSFIGGKLETTDKDLISGLRREKNEEVGKAVKMLVLPNPTYNAFFIKQGSQQMILPHYVAIFGSGEIELSGEYSEYKWVRTEALDSLEPKIENIPEIVNWALDLGKILKKSDLVEI